MQRLAILILLYLAGYPLAADAAVAVRITNVSDIAVGARGMGDPPVTASIDMCIYSVGVLTNDYSVKVTADTGGMFLKSGNKQLPISMFWNDGGVGNLSGTGAQLAYNSAAGGRKNSNAVSQTCTGLGGGPNARLTLKISQTDMDAALQGTYQGVIDILISPG